MATRMKEKYLAEAVPALQQKFGYKNVMEIPKLEKIVINMGLGDCKDNAKAMEMAVNELTAIAGQYYKGANQGLLLGYQRFGRLCFEVGTDEDWFTLWTDDERLALNEWNHVAAVFDGEEGFMALYLNGNLLIVAVGALLAVPLAKAVMDAIYPSFICNVACSMKLAFPWYLYAIICTAVILVYFIINRLLIGTINRISPAEILKNRE